MAKMPNDPPFQNKEGSEDPRDEKDPDPYKQRGTYTKEIMDHESQIKWEDANPVKENGEVRPWDDLNDFKDPKAKVDRAKKIADNIFELTQRKVSSLSAKHQTRTDVRDIKKKFKKSIRFMKRVVKESRRKDRQDRKESKEFDKRMRALKKSKPGSTQSSYANMMDKMEQEDSAVIKPLSKIDTPAQWALDEVQ